MEAWRKCSVCKTAIQYNKIYFKCSLSSCNRKIAPTQFCSVTCWDVHQSILNHKSAGADEYRSPKSAEVDPDKVGVPRRVLVRPKGPSDSGNQVAAGSFEKDVLIVVSKLKKYVNDRSGLNTSADVTEALSDIVRRECDKAIQKAHQAERKTLMARDF